MREVGKIESMKEGLLGTCLFCPGPDREGGETSNCIASKLRRGGEQPTCEGS
jgi:hypothetical protein